MRSILTKYQIVDKLGHSILKILEKSLSTAKKMRVRLGNRNKEYHVDDIAADNSYLVSEAGCSCTYSVEWGLPCVHQIATYRYIQDGFPALVIHRRWWISEHEDTLPERSLSLPVNHPLRDSRASASSSSSSDSEPSDSASSDSDELPTPAPGCKPIKSAANVLD